MSQFMNYNIVQNIVHARNFFQHDTTVTAFLEALDIWNGKVPDYASLLIFELHELESSSQLQMKILLKEDSVKHPESDPVAVPLKSTCFPCK